MKKRLFISLLIYILAICLLMIPTRAHGQSAAPTLKPAAENRYRLNPGDVLDIVYRYTPEFNQTVTIQPDGYVILQIVGDVKIGTMTVEEARAEISKRASVRLKDPEVTILLKEFQKPYFVVAGEVVQPGRVEMREQRMTALQAIMMSGGFRDSAKVSQVVVFRKINQEIAEVKTVNLKDIRKTSDLENDMVIEAGDMIFVPRNRWTKLERYMRLTSLVSLINPLTNLMSQWSTPK